ncbi:competence type IV pilus major pilin ComGC [Texcoconibacillus texcoconensis]|uniref:ComG operon protein 3 n=1 Tax=Texcoconibacillus texcoconensis TaxID=1095777 RepID=A0A840QP57_9BACI|nr:competence type IV pilus major pilin ComGC [Texcoconibacillus texcoconensis]MBB5173107.1 competence protein ComGC [Texcoconibacillus texcoconensis]
MKDYLRKSEQGFTLIEMLIVLMIISVLLLIAVPNMAKNNEVATDKSTEATIDLLQAQIAAYEIENRETPESLEVLKKEGYVDQIECPSGGELTIVDGQVVKKDEEDE